MTDGWRVSREALASITHWNGLIFKTWANPPTLLFFFSSWCYTFSSLCFFWSFWLTSTSSIITSVFVLCFLLLHGFSLWIHLQFNDIFFFRNAESKSPRWASPDWALLMDSWNPGLAKGSSQALVNTHVCSGADVTASRNSHSWKLLAQVLHIHLQTFVTGVRSLEAPG